MRGKEMAKKWCDEGAGNGRDGVMRGKEMAKKWCDEGKGNGQEMV
jgi:hypothetical protein